MILTLTHPLVSSILKYEDFTFSKIFYELSFYQSICRLANLRGGTFFPGCNIYDIYKISSKHALYHNIFTICTNLQCLVHAHTAMHTRTGVGVQLQSVPLPPTSYLLSERFFALLFSMKCALSVRHQISMK